MDSIPTHQALRGPMKRAQARAMETEVNSFLLDMHMDMSGTWLLPHKNTLCIIRYEAEHHQGGGEAPRVPTEEEGDQEEQVCRSQTTPCTRAPETSCPWAIQGVCAVASRAHGRVPCTWDPRAHGRVPCARALQGWPAEFGYWASTSSTSSPSLYIPYLGSCLGLEKTYVRYLRALLLLPPPLEIKAS